MTSDPTSHPDAGSATPAPHLALYRRWRAQTFSRIIGQDAVVATLRNAVRTGHVAHALLFVGPRGTGKTSLARIVAKALNCTNLRDGDPCDVCAACVSIREGRALDVVELDAATNNKVDDMRDLLERTWTAPSDLRRKVYIIDEVQRITQGWDVLLRTLEEPPDHVAFIFCTTDASQIRPAVLSRVQRFDFKRLTVAQIEGKLATILEADGRAADPEAISLVARQAAGGMRDAESMLDQLLASGTQRLTVAEVRDLLGLVEAETIEAFVDSLVSADPAGGIAILDAVDEAGRDLGAFLDQVVGAIRHSVGGRLAGLPVGRSGWTLPALTESARRIAAIDPSRPGAGGLRFQLELALLSGVSAGSPGTGVATIATGASLSVDGRPVWPRRSARASVPALGAVDEPPARRTVSAIESPGAGPASMALDGEPPEAAGVESGASGRPKSSAVDAASAPSESAPGPRNSAAPAASRHLDTTPAGPLPTRKGAPARPGTAPSTSEADHPPATVAGSPSPIVTDLDGLRALDRIWPSIVADLSQSPPIKPLISVCRPIDVDGDVVTLGFPEGMAFLRDVAERRRASLEAGIGRAVGRPIVVRLVATNLDLLPPAIDDESERVIAAARRIFADDLIDAGEVS